MAAPSAFDEARMLAWDLLHRIESSQAYADLLLDRTFSQKPHLRPLDRGFIQELVLGTLRWQGRLDVAILQALNSPGKKVDPRLFQLLRLGAYQILCMDRVPASAAVNESVRLARAGFKDERIAGFTNAVLRTITRRKDDEGFPPFETRPVDFITQALSHPKWLVEGWVREFGPEAARAICAANNQRPPTTIRVNTLKIKRETLRRQFTALGIPAEFTAYSPEGLTLGKAPLAADEGLFQRGLYFFQDEASQAIAHLLSPRPGERTLDACAAPGGKSTHLAQLMGNRGEIISLDIYDAKVKLIQENYRRLSLSIVKALRADVSRPLPLPEETRFDKILVDAPCTALGILHRNPEIKWRRLPEDGKRLQTLQTQLLDNLCSRLQPQGILVYSTCTMNRDENEGVVEGFLKAHPDFRQEDPRPFIPASLHPLIREDGFLCTYPKMIAEREDYRLDGFFAARMRKS